MRSPVSSSGTSSAARSRSPAWAGRQVPPSARAPTATTPIGRTSGSSASAARARSASMPRSGSHAHARPSPRKAIRSERIAAPALRRFAGSGGSGTPAGRERRGMELIGGLVGIVHDREQPALRGPRVDREEGASRRIGVGARDDDRLLDELPRTSPGPNVGLELDRATAMGTDSRNRSSAGGGPASRAVPAARPRSRRPVRARAPPGPAPSSSSPDRSPPPRRPRAPPRWSPARRRGGRWSLGDRAAQGARHNRSPRRPLLPARGARTCR